METVKIKLSNGAEIEVPKDQAELAKAIAEASLAAVEAGNKAQLEVMLTEALAGEAVSNRIGEVVAQAIKPVTERVEQLATAKPPAPGDQGGNGGQGGGAQNTDEPPAWAKALIEQVGGIVQEREGAKKRATVEQTVKGYFDQHLPNLKGRDRFVQRAIAAGLDSEDAVKQWWEDTKADLEAAGVKVESLTASAEGEGGKTGEADEKAQRIEAVRNAKRPLATVPVGAK